MRERLSPLPAPRLGSFRYPRRNIEPEGFHQPITTVLKAQKAPAEFTIETLPNGKYRAILREGKISSTIPFSATEDDIACIQQELAEYIRDESPSLEACTIFLMAHIFNLDIRKALTDTPEASKYARQGRSAMYIHEAYEGGKEEVQEPRAGRPRQDAHKIKVDIRPGSHIANLIHAGFTRFFETRADKKAILSQSKAEIR